MRQEAKEAVELGGSNRNPVKDDGGSAQGSQGGEGKKWVESGVALGCQSRELDIEEAL